jgi:hypothetical protein
MKSRVSESQIQLAVLAYRFQVREPRQSIQTIAIEYNVPYSSLQQRLKGRQPMEQHHEARQLLTPAEEAAVISYLDFMARTGFPYQQRHVVATAQYVLSKRSQDVVLGKNWYARFSKRHPEVRAKYCRDIPLSKVRLPRLVLSFANTFRLTLSPLSVSQTFSTTSMRSFRHIKSPPHVFTTSTRRATL